MPYETYIYPYLAVGIILSYSQKDNLRPFVAISTVVFWPIYAVIGLIDLLLDLIQKVFKKRL